MGLASKDENPSAWRTTDFAIAYEPYGYLLREGNSDFRIHQQHHPFHDQEW